MRKLENQIQWKFKDKTIWENFVSSPNLISRIKKRMKNETHKRFCIWSKCVSHMDYKAWTLHTKRKQLLLFLCHTPRACYVQKFACLNHASFHHHSFRSITVQRLKFLTRATKKGVSRSLCTCYCVCLLFFLSLEMYSLTMMYSFMNTIWIMLI